MRLQHKLLLLLLPLVVIPLIGLGGLVGHRVQQATIGLLVDQIDDTLVQALRASDQSVQAARADVAMLARSALARRFAVSADGRERPDQGGDAAPGVREAFVAELTTLRLLKPQYHALRFLLTDGSEDADVARAVHKHRPLREVHPEFLAALESSDESVISRFALEPGEHHWSLLVGARIPGESARSGAADPQSADGYLVAHVSLEFLEQMARELRIGKTGGVRFEQPGGVSLFDESHGPTLPEARVSARYDVGDGVVAMGFVSEQEIRETTRAVYGAVGAVTAIALALTVVAVLFAVRRVILAPLDEMARAVARFGQGDGSPPVLRTAGDELGAHAAALQQLMSNVQQYQQDLKSQALELERVSDAKSEFLASMSHEVRTPINGIMGMSELLMHDELSERHRRFARNIHRSGQQLLLVVNDVLDFSKMEAGRLELHCAAVDPTELIEEVCEQFAAIAEAAGIDIVCASELPAGLRVSADAGRLRQILVNLVSNAVKFTSNGAVVVSAAQAAIDAPATGRDVARLRLSVTDTGPGLDENERGQIFEAFVQADSPMTRRKAGTGLGLAICRQLGALMDASLAVESQPGQGLTFTFEAPFPLVTGGEEAEAAKRIEDRRVLVADSSDQRREWIARQLGRWGATVATLATPATALDTVCHAARDGYDFDLIILGAAAGDGWEPPSELLAALRPVPVVLIQPLSKYTARRHPAGVRGTLSVPVRVDALRQQVRRATSSAPADAFVPEPDNRGTDIAPVGKPVALAGDRLRVLVVEDNPVNQELADAMLQMLGCDVEIAKDGRQGVEAMRRTSPDLVLMDCQMPELNGFEATARIRDWEKTHGLEPVPIVALTANAMDGDREQCLQAGMTGYIAKPFSTADLASVVNAVRNPTAKAS